MTQQPSPSTNAGHSDRVPDELLDQLHAANQRLHESREQLEEALDGDEMRHQERVDAAADQLRRAQHDWEEVDRKIHDTLHLPS
jgi:hypothetical protein